MAIALSALPFAYPLLNPDLVGGPLPGVAGVAGMLGALAMWWQILLGARQVSRRLSADRGRIMAAHAWLGTLGAFFVLLHPLLEMIADRHGLAYLVLVDFTWVESAYTSLGRLALMMFVLLWLSSTLLRAATRHRLWQRVHYLSYPLVALVFVHAHGIGTFLAELPWLRAYWLGLAAGFGGVAVWRVAGSLRAARYRLTASERLPGGVTVYRLRGRGVRSPLPGQFCHLRVGLLSRSHPFSVVRADDATGELVFAVKDAGPFTARLRDLPEGATVLVDGPYGTFTREAQLRDRPAVLVASGIGVTPFVALALRHPDATLFHAARHPIYGRDLVRRLGPRYHLAHPDRERLTAARVTRDAPADAAYFVCGAPGFVTPMVRELRARGVPAKRLFVERFEW
ncbi:ferric reductase-like transmembrane domain-containing protein [Nonomuraea antimicrobica]|uniref:Ferric reductase-like transmembrane domain-containing protein n=1 Tax=Nonomuraea antimicrobica TaxID=561173 RepID=A0ABP7DYV7_9ACTN